MPRIAARMPSVAPDRGSPASLPATPEHPCAERAASLLVRRYLLILVALVVALGGVAVLAVIRSADARPRPPGRPRGRPRSEARAGTRADSGGPRPLDRDHRGARQQDRRRASPRSASRATTRSRSTLPGVHDTARAARLIGQTAQLEFYDLQGDALSPRSARRARSSPRPRSFRSCPASRSSPRRGRRPPGTSTARRRSASPGRPTRGRRSCASSPAARLPRARSSTRSRKGGRSSPAARRPALSRRRRSEPGVLLPLQVPAEQRRGAGPGAHRRGPERQRHAADFGQNNQPIVTLEFTDEGGDKFHEITRELASAAARRRISPGTSDEENFNQSFAIVLDGEIRSFPSIDFTDLPDGISGGQARSSRLDYLEEAEDLALVLQTGALPVEFVQVERSDISATLGEDSLREAIIAGIGGLIAVALFLLIFYRFLGVIAIIGLAIYGVLLYGAILIFDVTLTLPGFAGLILTIGVAADANIVIFERIKEEVRAGKSVRAAIAERLPQGLQHDHRRERRDDDHRVRPLRRRDGGRQGLRPHAPRSERSSRW